MPLEYQRLVVTGEQHQRDVSQKCNAGLDAVGLEFDALKARVNTLETAIVELRVASQGAMTLLTPVAGPNITAAYQPITFYDTIPYQRGVTVNTTTGEFVLNIAGDWALWYRINLAVATSGSRRTFNVRAFNVTTATPDAGGTIFIPSQAPDVSDTLSFPFTTTAAEVGQTFRFEIGNASSNLTGVTWNASNLLVMFVGELGQLL